MFQIDYDLLELTFSKDEQVACISENDTCNVGAIQVVLCCSIGKGNLLFYMTGKQASSFQNRKTGISVRLVPKPKPLEMDCNEFFDYYHNCSNEEMCEVKKTRSPLPGMRPSV